MAWEVPLIIKEIPRLLPGVISKRDINSTVETVLYLKLSQFSCCWNKTMNWISLWYVVVQLYPWFEYNHTLFIITIHYHTPKRMEIKSRPKNTIFIVGKLTPTLNNQSETCNDLKLPFERTKLDSFIDNIHFNSKHSGLSNHRIVVFFFLEVENISFDFSLSVKIYIDVKLRTKRKRQTRK